MSVYGKGSRGVSRYRILVGQPFDDISMPTRRQILRGKLWRLWKWLWPIVLGAVLSAVIGYGISQALG